MARKRQLRDILVSPLEERIIEAIQRGFPEEHVAIAEHIPPRVVAYIWRQHTERTLKADGIDEMTSRYIEMAMWR